MSYIPFDLYAPLAQAAHTEDLGNLSLVSKDFNKATRDVQDWRILGPERLQSFLALVKKHPPFAAHIRGIDYRVKHDSELGTPLPDLRTRTLIEIITTCPRLRRLQVAALPAEPQSQRELFAILPKLSALRHLALGYANFLDLANHSVQFDLLPFLFERVHALESLHLGIGPAATEQQGLSLNGLVLPGARIIQTGKGPVTGPLQRLQIPKIFVSLSWLNGDMLSNLARAVFPAAQVLEVGVGGMPTLKDEEIIKAIGYASPQNLRALVLHYENAFTYTRVTGELLRLPACANLTSFLLDGTKDDQETIKQLPKSLRHLKLVVSARQLSFRGQADIGDLFGDHHAKGEAFVEAVIRELDSGALENLEHIEASVRVGVVEETAQALARACEGRRCRLSWHW
ncbi:hypothetical protein RQP46_006121 [Phenoliferia psychrophenolica]